MTAPTVAETSGEKKLAPDVTDGPVLERLLVVGTGSIAAADLPFWTTWLRTSYPQLQVQVVLTRTARRFVSAEVVSARAGRPVWEDEWATGQGARHVEWAQWAQAVLVYPCSFNFLARLANGLADSPSLLALHCTDAPVVVAPGLPPGGVRSAALRRHVRTLREAGVTVMAPRLGTSTTTGAPGAWVPELMPHCMEKLQGSFADADREALPSEGAEIGTPAW